MTEEQKPVLNLDFSQPGKIEDIKFSRQTPTPYIPSTYTLTAPDNYSAERAKEFLDKFQEIYLDKYLIATVIRNLVYSPDLVDLTETDLLDLADSISKL